MQRIEEIPFGPQKNNDFFDICVMKGNRDERCSKCDNLNFCDNCKEQIDMQEFSNEKFCDECYRNELDEVYAKLQENSELMKILQKN